MGLRIFLILLLGYCFSSVMWLEMVNIIVSQLVGRRSVSQLSFSELVSQSVSQLFVSLSVGQSFVSQLSVK